MGVLRHAERGSLRELPHLEVRERSLTPVDGQMALVDARHPLALTSQAAFGLWDETDLLIGIGVGASGTSPKSR